MYFGDMMNNWKSISIMSQETYAFKIGRKKGKLDYLLYVPDDYLRRRVRKWPLILFLHGSAERGDNPEVLKKHGIPKIVEEVPRFPFLTVSPQCPEGSTWGRHLEGLNSLLDHILGKYAADPHRLYLTGVSMGGNGVWQLSARYPGRFAAIAPVCGYGLASQGFPEKVCLLKNVPVWVFHGAQDLIVPVEESRRLVDMLRACGGDVRFTVYPKCGHDSWTRTYKSREIYRWFLSHSLRHSE